MNKPRICFTPECGKTISPHMPFCADHMKSIVSAVRS